ncbi:MAG: dinitrogenase iron-molybdenum cofactor biosynthesis protein [Desulfobacteraceae bacterium]|nr:dinitrogenase iron-molybdenum cofactor biosynthesis protein [Desulfobacteraceae bacterium]
MEFNLIAVPSELPGGLASNRSGHFGHCELFTLVSTRGGRAGEVSLLANPPHGAGGCLAPIGLLRERQVDAIVVGGVGKRPLQAMGEAGIAVLFAPMNEYPTVGAAVEGVLQAKLPRMALQQACTGHDCH